jgi:hypothetical protein
MQYLDPAGTQRDIIGMLAEYYALRCYAVKRESCTY